MVSRPALFVSSVSCGFPSPADEFIDSPLDLNELLVKKPAATFFVRAQGESMVGAGIFNGDLLIIDRSLTARHEHIVLAVIDGEFTLKRYLERGGKICLKAENPKYKEILIHESMDFKVWGVATFCIHQLR